MDVAEMRGRLRKKGRAFFDQRRQRDWGGVSLEVSGGFPNLTDRKAAPPSLRLALEKEMQAILKGHWIAFAHVPITVDDPPKWHRDYLAGQDVPTSQSAFQLNHRKLPGGADIKMIWELSRWFHLVRLAQAGWLLENETAVLKCVRWLEDWGLHNPPFVGWNWTSALESGIRLIQFAWIDALLAGLVERLGLGAEWDRLRYEILPPHVWFTWRHKSFGSSANNHLLGELSGLIVATSRWKNLQEWGAPLAELQLSWEREVLSQFAPDGGNREQALNYHLFSFEFSWQARNALMAAGLKVGEAVEERLARAAEFFLDVQVPSDPWDYGDSDNGFVTPLFEQDGRAGEEWYEWLEGKRGGAIGFWLGAAPLTLTPALAHAPALHSDPAVKESGNWRVFAESGIAVQCAADWTLRWDFSPLGYLSTAAHGHLDALHLSIWFRGIAMIVDPGTGAYYADEKVRKYLSSWEAHNGPRIVGVDWPRRLGPFLWSDHHSPPTWEATGADKMTAQLRLLDTPRAGMLPKLLSRSIARIDSGDGWLVEDVNETGVGIVSVRWQFPPGSVLTQHSEGLLQLERNGQSIWIQVEAPEIKAYPHSGSSRREEAHIRSEPPYVGCYGICSPSFRRIERGPYLELSSSHKPCLLRSRFLASRPS
jgi:hypothetical protein